MHSNQTLNFWLLLGNSREAEERKPNWTKPKESRGNPRAEESKGNQIETRGATLCSICDKSWGSHFFSPTKQTEPPRPKEMPMKSLLHVPQRLTTSHVKAQVEYQSPHRSGPISGTKASAFWARFKTDAIGRKPTRLLRRAMTSKPRKR